MAIVCATNLSAESQEAADVAAALARRLAQPLVLVGILEGEPSDAPGNFQLQLEAEALRLEASTGVASPGLVTRRSVEEALDDEECRGTRWAVVPSGGWRTPAWRRASMPERMARHGCAPVLMVHRCATLLEWARGRRRLLVLAGVDPGSSTSDAAVTFLRELRRVGPCDVLATYVCSPLEERERLGIHTPVHVEVLEPPLRGMDALDPSVERVLRREVHERLGDLEGEGHVEVVLEPGFGRPADHLLHVAHARAVDLVVVGMHMRGGMRRLWHGSVSAGVLRHAEQSVVCVPPSLREPRRAGPPRSVLVPVDFSEASQRAISQACTLVGPGGRVHLLHVHRRRMGDAASFQDHYGVLPEPPKDRDRVLQRLWGLVPRDEDARAVQWTVEGVTGDDVTRAICQATEREGVDLVCVGTSPQSSPEPDALEGAVARALVARCRRPVMVVPTA